MPKKFKLGEATKMLAADHRPSDPEDDPYADLRGDTSGSLETDCAEEVDALAAGFRARQTQENDRFRRAVDTEHWFAVCFLTRAHKQAFLAGLPGVAGAELGEGGIDAKYLDGHLVAKALGIELPT